MKKWEKWITQQQWIQNQSAPTVAGEKLTAHADAQQEAASLKCGTTKKERGHENAIEEEKDRMKDNLKPYGHGKLRQEFPE